jgi:hypothetical protein
MKAAVIVTRVLISLSGTALLLLGILFWSGRALSLLPLHMLLGLVLVLALWLGVGLALAARVSAGLIVLVFLWSLIMPVLGVKQLQLLPGSTHWMIQLLHLLVGIAAMGLGHLLAARIAATRAAVDLRTPGVAPPT